MLTYVSQVSEADVDIRNGHKIKYQITNNIPTFQQHFVHNNNVICFRWKEN